MLRTSIARLRTESVHCVCICTRGMAKRKTGSSNVIDGFKDWLRRQMSDPYVRYAVQQRYRARSAFKLLQMNERQQLVRPGHVVLDCGAAPGSWSQVLSEAVNSTGAQADRPKGFVLAADLDCIAPIEGVHVESLCDLTASGTPARLRAVLHVHAIEPAAFDIICSDMSPKASGTHQLDHDRSMKLLDAVVDLALRRQLLRPTTGTLLAKVLMGATLSRRTKALAKHFETVKIIKPAASRAESSETYILARNFKDS